MSHEANIERSDGWHRYEAKDLRISITDDGGDPVDLTGTSLRWLISRQAGGDSILEKTDSDGITVEGDDDEIAVIAIAANEYDYLVAGVYYHELWDTDTPVLLAWGTVYLGPGAEPPA